jgi:hypothetical protein
LKGLTLQHWWRIGEVQTSCQDVGFSKARKKQEQGTHILQSDDVVKYPVDNVRKADSRKIVESEAVSCQQQSEIVQVEICASGEVALTSYWNRNRGQRVSEIQKIEFVNVS